MKDVRAQKCAATMRRATKGRRPNYVCAMEPPKARKVTIQKLQAIYLRICSLLQASCQLDASLLSAVVSRLKGTGQRKVVSRVW